MVPWQDPPPGSAHPPCGSPKKAEQDIELWKKQEAAAKEAECGPPGSQDQPEVMVAHVSLCPGWDSPERAAWWGRAKQVLVGEGEDGDIPSSGCGRRPRSSSCAVPNRSCPSRKPSGSRWT